MIPQRDSVYPGERLDAVHTYTKDERRKEILFAYCKELPEQNKVTGAWQVILSLKEMPVPV